MAVAPPPARNKKSNKSKVVTRDIEPKVNKTFQVATWDTAKEGQRIIVYGDSGMGKTTLCSMLSNPKFADFKGGSDKIRHPVTGDRLQHIPEIETFDDLRSVCRQADLFDSGDSLVVDTGTDFEDRALDWVIANVPHEKGVSYKKIERIEDYGWGKGYRHLYDTMKLPLADFDVLIRKGVNVVVTCQMQQVEIANASGEDFLCDVPKLQKAHGKTTPPVWSMWNEWADHVLKIGFHDVQTKDGKAASSGDRVVYVHGQVHFKAKSRTIPSTFPVVTFDGPEDNAIWQFLFDECWREMEEE